MKKFYILGMVLCMALGLAAQTATNLAYFPFTGNQEAPNTSTFYLATAGAQAGTAGLYLDGTHGSSAWLQDSELTSNGGSLINALGDVQADKDLATINNSANGKSIVFHFSTEGYQQVVLSMAARRTGNGFSSTVWSYSTDGITFYTLEGFSTVPDTVKVYRYQELDLSGITAINNQEQVFLKCTYDGASAYNGSFRIDNVQINAYPAGPDIWAPYITSLTVLNENTLTLQFNEEVSAETAEDLENYETEDLNYSAASVAGSVVTLTINPALTEGETYTLIVSNVEDLAGNVMAPDTMEFSYGVSPEFRVATIAELRSKMDVSNYDTLNLGHVVYKLTGEVIVTAIAEHNNQKVLQDSTGAVLIYDPGNLLGSLEVGDKVKDIFGTLTNYWGFLEFQPTQAYGEKVSSFEGVTPLTITLEQLNDLNFMLQHQAELITLEDVTFTAEGQFATLTTYEITQNGVSANAVYPYFQDADIVGADIPTGTVSVTGFNFATSKIGNTHPAFRYYIVPRRMNDFGTGVNSYVNESDVIVAPNPAVDQVRVSISNEQFQVSNCFIMDINGQVVASQSVEDNTFNLNVSHLASGFYFLRLTDGKSNVTTKFVKR